MKTTLTLLLLFVSSTIRAEETEGCYTRDQWKVRLEAMRGFDEIRMTLGQRAVPVPKKKIGKEGIQFEQGLALDSFVGAVTCIEDGDSFIQLLQFEPNIPNATHGCYGLFNLSFYRKGKLVGSLHYAHGQYWCPISKATANAINLWLENKGLPIHSTLKEDKNEG